MTACRERLARIEKEHQEWCEKNGLRTSREELEAALKNIENECATLEAQIRRLEAYIDACEDKLDAHDLRAPAGRPDPL